MARKKHLVELESFVNVEPVSLIARLRDSLPLIEASLQAGHTLRSIHRLMNEAGFSIRYNTLAAYRRRLKQQNLPALGPKVPRQPALQDETQESEPVQSPGRLDPAASFRKQLKKRPNIEYPSEPPDESKLF